MVSFGDSRLIIKWVMGSVCIGGEVERAKGSGRLSIEDKVMPLIEVRLRLEELGELNENMFAPCSVSALEMRDVSGKLEVLVVGSSVVGRLIGERELSSNDDGAAAGSVAAV